MRCSRDEWLTAGCFYAFGLFDEWKTYHARLLENLCPPHLSQIAISSAVDPFDYDICCERMQVHDVLCDLRNCPEGNYLCAHT
jgi:hypothetical protein